MILAQHGILRNRVISGAGPAPSPYPTDGLISRFAFEDNLDDSYGSYDGSIDTGSISYTTGTVGKCIVSSNNSRVDTGVPTSYFEGTNSFTAVYWLNFTNNDGSPHYLGGINNVITNCSIRIGCENSEKLSFQRYYSAGFNNKIVSSSSYNDGSWHMMACIYNGSTMYLNIDNGTEDLSLGSTGSMPSLSGYYWKICHIDFANNQRSWYGNIDQHYVYNKVLSASELTQLWNSGSGV